jgi:ATP-binding cassette, subfamily B, bacterial HlyB/CyaB
MIKNQDNKVKIVDDPGLAALVTIASFHNVAADSAQLRHVAAAGNGQFSEKEQGIVI